MARATTHISVYLPPRCFLQHSQEQDRSDGSEGCGPPRQHQHRWPPAPDQETATHFQQSLRPSSPSCLCPPVPPPSDLVQGVVMSTPAVMHFNSLVQTPIFSDVVDILCLSSIGMKCRRSCLSRTASIGHVWYFQPRIPETRPRRLNTPIPIDNTNRMSGHI